MENYPRQIVNYFDYERFVDSIPSMAEYQPKGIAERFLVWLLHLKGLLPMQRCVVLKERFERTQDIRVVIDYGVLMTRIWNQLVSLQRHGRKPSVIVVGPDEFDVLSRSPNTQINWMSYTVGPVQGIEVPLVMYGVQIIVNPHISGVVVG